VRTREADGEVDPHWWQDPRNAEIAVRTIRDALAKADPDGTATYDANAEAYLGRIAALDRAIATCMDGIPREERRLVTNHDALGYFAQRYGITVVGAVIPALSTAARPSAGETQELVDTIRREHVSTIFPESSLNPRLEKAIAADAGAKVGPALWADSLGPKGSTGATYLDSLRFNAEAMADGFTGRAGSCDLPR
jgi:ABC-type Zn uptake system ZnuABC Zn-binding protein ZnuA